MENIIRSDINTELLEILELYCELLLARAGLLEGKECDPGLEEAVRSIIYAAPRTEIKELQQVRQLLVEKYGKEFALEAMENPGGTKVAQRVVRKLTVEPPSRELVQNYLKEIARAYGVGWPRRTEPDEEDDGGDEGGKKTGERVLEDPLVAEMGIGMTTTVAARAANEEELSRATPPRSATTTSKSVSVAPPSPSSDNVNPKIKLPDTPELKADGKGMSILDDDKKSSGDGDGGGRGARGEKTVVGGTIPDADELAARFAALKRKY